MKTGAKVISSVHATEGIDTVSRRRLSVSDYYAMADAGILHPDERLELIAGEIIAQMSPQRIPHAASISRVARALNLVFGSGFTLRIQLPLRLSDFDEPEPDVLVCRGDIETFDDRHPNGEDVALAVEIADSSLRQDLIEKSALYAKFGIPEYWVVNLVKRELLVFREPRTLEKPGYSKRDTLALKSEVAPLSAQDANIAVASLFPKGLS